MPPWLCKSLPDGSAHLVRDGAPLAFVGEALACARAVQKRDWHPIHSKTNKDVFRLVTMSGAAHTRALEEEGEEKCISRNEEANALAKNFKIYAEAALNQAGVFGKPVTGVEYLKTLAGGLGQNPHLESFFGAWALALCLQDGSAPTVLRNYHYHDWPLNMDDGNCPKGWDNLEPVVWAWKAGDFMIWKANRIHNGPPNPGPDDRFLLFGSTAFYNAPCETFTDSIVVFENIFYGVALPACHLCTNHTLMYTRCTPPHTHIHTRREAEFQPATYTWRLSGHTWPWYAPCTQ